MGRSVSSPTNAIARCYQDVSQLEDRIDFEMYRDDLRESIKFLFPSMNMCGHIIGKEDCAIMYNSHALIGLSEYCGLTCIWLLPSPDSEYPELAMSWCNQVSGKFEEAFGEYRRVGVFSNGEAIYERI